MSSFDLVVSVVAAVILFMHSLHGFAADLQKRGGQAMQSVLASATKSKARGFLLGAIVTAIVQSSSAVTSIAVGLVAAGLMTFPASLAVLLGANVGTTATAWLVSFKLTGIGPYLIVAGAALGLLPVRAAVLGKSIFYLGFILFALDLISESIAPFRDNPMILEVLALSRNAYLGALLGALATALLQSSSVTIGIGILLTQQGLLDAAQVIPIVIGANLGTTVTGLLASAGLGVPARRAAVANVLFNLLGVVVFLPILVPFSRGIVGLVGEPQTAVAWAHLTFNLAAAALGFLLMGHVEALSKRIVPDEMQTVAAPAKPRR
jgi:phosphate:Na+ symporter